MLHASTEVSKFTIMDCIILCMLCTENIVEKGKNGGKTHLLHETTVKHKQALFICAYLFTFCEIHQLTLIQLLSPCLNRLCGGCMYSFMCACLCVCQKEMKDRERERLAEGADLFIVCLAAPLCFGCTTIIAEDSWMGLRGRLGLVDNRRERQAE